MNQLDNLFKDLQNLLYKQDHWVEDQSERDWHIILVDDLKEVIKKYNIHHIKNNLKKDGVKEIYERISGLTYFDHDEDQNLMQWKDVEYQFEQYDSSVSPIPSENDTPKGTKE